MGVDVEVALGRLMLRERLGPARTANSAARTGCKDDLTAGSASSPAFLVLNVVHRCPWHATISQPSVQNPREPRASGPAWHGQYVQKDSSRVLPVGMGKIGSSLVWARRCQCPGNSSWKCLSRGGRQLGTLPGDAKKTPRCYDAYFWPPPLSSSTPKRRATHPMPGADSVLSPGFVVPLADAGGHGFSFICCSNQLIGIVGG